MKCINCDIEFEGRKDAKFCSPKCRVTFSRKQSLVTDNVTLSAPAVTDNFEFYTIAKARDPLPNQTKETDTKSKLRAAKYWYDVPLGAIPVIQKDWPPIPSWMNGRQYFLWWKNEFKVNEDIPEIHNPFPAKENVHYEMGGEGARRWGA